MHVQVMTIYTLTPYYIIIPDAKAKPQWHGAHTIRAGSDGLVLLSADLLLDDADFRCISTMLTEVNEGQSGGRSNQVKRVQNGGRLLAIHQLALFLGLRILLSPPDRQSQGRGHRHGLPGLRYLYRDLSAGAIQLEHFTDNQILAEVNALCPPKIPANPGIVGF